MAKILHRKYADEKQKYYDKTGVEITRKIIPEPTVSELAANFADATERWAKAGFPVVTETVYQSRAAICAACPLWDDKARMGLGKCKHPKCGCTRIKRWWATERCPDGKWEADLARRNRAGTP